MIDLVLYSKLNDKVKRNFMIVKVAGEGLFKFQILAETTGTCAVSCVNYFRRLIPTAASPRRK